MNSHLPCPPGYKHLKALPSSSACMTPAGVSSPPHFRISNNVDCIFDPESVSVSEDTFRRPSRKYLNCTLRLIPEKWPYLKRSSCHPTSLSSAKADWYSHFQNSLDLLQIALRFSNVGLLFLHRALIDFVQEASSDVQHFLQLIRPL